MEVNMRECPLAPPRDKRSLTLFLRHFRLCANTEPLRLLRDVATAFANLPYENLTKIIKSNEVTDPGLARRLPGEVLADHVALGTGGTCFSLTATLLHLVRSLGWKAEPLLADRRYGENTHCAMLVWIDDRPHLVDPGYLIVEPIPLESTAESRVKTAFNELILSPHAQADKLDLLTVGQGRQTYRLTFRTAPADEGEFLRAWDASFAWDMMRYPLLTRVTGSKQVYLQGDRFQTRRFDRVERCEIPPDRLGFRIAAEFGIDPRIAATALNVLKRRGEPYG
jgi:arylamine N-acetyltransferase